MSWKCDGRGRRWQDQQGHIESEAPRRTKHGTEVSDNVEELHSSFIMFIHPTSIHSKCCYTASRMSQALMEAKLKPVETRFACFAVPIFDSDGFDYASSDLQ